MQKTTNWSRSGWDRLSGSVLSKNTSCKCAQQPSSNIKSPLWTSDQTNIIILMLHWKSRWPTTLFLITAGKNPEVWSVCLSVTATNPGLIQEEASQPVVWAPLNANELSLLYCTFMCLKWQSVFSSLWTVTRQAIHQPAVSLSLHKLYGSLQIIPATFSSTNTVQCFSTWGMGLL